MKQAYNLIVDLLRKMTSYLHSYTYPICTLLDRRVTSVLDVGCGGGNPMKIIKKHRRLYSVGIDVFAPYIQGQRIHDHYVVGDARFLPFKKRSFDAVICLQLIEHIPKKDGARLLKEIEAIARRQVVVTTPVGFMPRNEVCGNPYERHVSGWEREEVEKLGYDIRSHGARFIFGNGGIVHLKPFSILSRFTFLIEPFLDLFFHFFPMGDYYLICNKFV